MLDVHLPALAHDVVELSTTIIHVFQVGGRRKPSVVHHLDTEPCLDTAACSERMSEVAFQRVDGDSAAEDRTGRPTLGDITPLCRGAVTVYEAYGFGRQVCIAQSQAQSDSHSL